MDNHAHNLSTIFPKDTSYFYGFPAELDSGFYNGCLPEIEELVAMRPVVCAGPDAKVVTFASTVTDRVWSVMEGDLGIPMARKDKIISLPPTIASSIKGRERNELVKRALATLIPDGSLIMAQPYVDDRLDAKYLIDPRTTIWLNDKQNIRDFVPRKYQTPEYASFENGAEFSQADGTSYIYPCVVKVSSSSAGDGVRICKSRQELQAAQKKFKDITHPILIQRYIESPLEVDVKFIVPQDPNASCSVIGYSREIAGPNGEYLGGIVENQGDTKYPAMEHITRVLLQEILPILRQKGWFGIGGVDVLIDQNGDFHFSDFNCRMTATMAQQLQGVNGHLGRKSVAVFNGEFRGDYEAFKRRIVPNARHGGNAQKLNIVALAEGKGRIRMHGGVLFDQDETLRENIVELQRLGVRSDIFSQL